MAFRFPQLHLSLLFISILSFSNVAILAHKDEDPTVQIMEEFSGYPSINEPHSLSSLAPVHTETLQQQIDELSTFSDTPAPSVTRILYSKNDVLARRYEPFPESVRLKVYGYIKNIMEITGLFVREDAVGNIFGRWEGYDPKLTAVATGSHIDAIPYSGKYDGVIGVLGALEAINVLRRSSFKPKRSLEVIMFTSEEPTRFGISCLGSRLLAGSEPLAKSLTEAVVDGQNISFFDASRSAGYANDQGDLSSVFLKKGSYYAFLELHIEQGPILEEEGTSIGVVTAIAAPASIKVVFEGNGGHAGAVLMPYSWLGAALPGSILLSRLEGSRDDVMLTHISADIVPTVGSADVILWSADVTPVLAVDGIRHGDGITSCKVDVTLIIVWRCHRLRH
ncbi:hypothetical protein GIB67_023966 [Kingdonia uniflora]|uniref:Uncharacterized protein n=1 Tax=Kingdonia uniflora TaxID=39325 RepID=A0A7J7LPQ4_9MAGN|nr:hypothetical protein GIB67_023966 [Kingdonia uniflora]